MARFRMRKPIGSGTEKVKRKNVVALIIFLKPKKAPKRLTA